jgi:hypothetical protein
MRQRTLYNLLTVAALLTAMGTDQLAQAATAIRADAVVQVAERMANRFGRTYSEKERHPVAQFARTERAITPQCRLASIRPQSQSAGVESNRVRPALLHLPPPLA